MNFDRASPGKVCKKWNMSWQCAAWTMITIWLSPNHHNVNNKHMRVYLVACFRGKHALYYSYWTKRYISDSVFFCVMFLLCYRGYEYICQAAVHISLILLPSEVHAYCCSTRSLVTAAISTTVISVWMKCWYDIDTKINLNCIYIK